MAGYGSQVDAEKNFALPAKCICIFCKAKRAEKEKQDEERRRPKE